MMIYTFVEATGNAIFNLIKCHCQILKTKNMLPAILKRVPPFREATISTEMGIMLSVFTCFKQTAGLCISGMDSSTQSHGNIHKYFIFMLTFFLIIYIFFSYEVTTS